MNLKAVIHLSVAESSQTIVLNKRLIIMRHIVASILTHDFFHSSLTATNLFILSVEHSVTWNYYFR